MHKPMKSMRLPRLSSAANLPGQSSAPATSDRAARVDQPIAPIGGSGRSWARRWIFSTDHRVIGVQYLMLSLLAVAAGTLLSLVMRLHMVWPALRFPLLGVLRPEQYLAVMTMHGTLMVFFVLTTAPVSGFSNLVLPAQIGARRMAFPRLNAAGFWCTAVAFAVLIAGVFAPGGGPISGWTAYPPLSAIPKAGPGQGAGMDFWIASLAIFCIASMMGAVNALTTIVSGRCRGMTLGRLPLTVWSWLVTSILVLLAFSVLLAALVLLVCDRHFGTSFFVPSWDVISGTVLHRGDGSPLLWLHLFWFFGHPEVYITILPGMGLVSSLLANFTHRPVIGYRMLAGTTVLIGVMGFIVWGHHMFVSGINPYAGTAFSLTSMAIAVPSTAKVLSWLGEIWEGGLEKRPPLLFALGFVSLFITGGLTGLVLAQPALDSYLHNTYFVVAHFHLVMGMAGVFSVFAGIYYWFPLMSGRMMHEGLGKWHFWLTLTGAYATFLPMHLTGLAGQPRQYAEMTAAGSPFLHLLPLEKHITYAAIFLASAQLLFLWNLLWSAWRGQQASNNPWGATTMEWLPAIVLTEERSSVPYAKGGSAAATLEEDRRRRYSAKEAPLRLPIVVTRGPYEYRMPEDDAGFRMQWEPAAELE